MTKKGGERVKQNQNGPFLAEVVGQDPDLESQMHMGVSCWLFARLP